MTKFTFILFLLTISHLSFAINQKIKIQILNVGHGDAILIQTPQNKIILIDTGKPAQKNNESIAQKIIIPAIKKISNKIECLILTHPHADHIGGAYEIIKQFKIGSIYDSGYASNYQLYKKLLLTIEQKKILYKIPVPREILNITPSLKLIFFNPPRRQFKNSHSDANNNSIVFKLIYKNFSMLFTGDIEKEAEKRLCKGSFNLKSTIIKVPHHGSRTSIYKPFIAKVNPEYGIISVKSDNPFGNRRLNLPSLKTLKLYKKRGINIFTTDKNGTITIISDGKKYTIATETN